MRIHCGSFAILASLLWVGLLAGGDALAKGSSSPARQLSTSKPRRAKSIASLMLSLAKRRSSRCRSQATNNSSVASTSMRSGRIPTLNETRDFRRRLKTRISAAQLIASLLLESPGHVSHEYNYWADILRVKDAADGVGRAFYVLWIKDSLATNKPYDQFVRELITAKGGGWERGNGAYRLLPP